MVDPEAQAPHARRRRLLLGAALAAVAMLGTVVARAQLRPATHSEPIHGDQPVFYQADEVEYNRDQALVTLTGHVEIWQGDRILRADRVTYDRDTGVAAAMGNVVLVEPDGQVLFAEYAELSEGMKNGVLRDLRARLPQNGQLVANGARRTDASINELSRAVYTTCNLCKKDPSAAPEWDIRARSALQDVENKKIEYRDAVVDIYGVPVMYMPFLAHPDPSERRASGILIPNAGYNNHLGAFLAVPYYWVINGQSDVTITPIVSSMQGGGVEGEFRQMFNNGKITVRGAVASDEGGIGWYEFARGDFSIDDTWRWGFDINRASGVDFLRDYMIPGGLVPVLTSSVWLEGFGEGSYARLDVRAYQSIVNGNSVFSQLPYVLPHYQYNYFGEPDDLGGRLSLTADAFNVVRESGTSTQRGRLSLDWQRPFQGQFGDLWNLTLHLDSAVYSAQDFEGEPNFGASGQVQTAQAMPTVATLVRLPLVRDAGSWGTQTIEPIAQLIVAPNGSKYGTTTLANGTTVSTSRVPNEDSLDQELTDANLFSINRFPGVDRLEGGIRMNAALHGAWNFPGGALIDGLVGKSYRTRESSPWWVGSGLSNEFSDIVSRVTFSPGSYFDLTGRARFDPSRDMTMTLADLLASAGPQAFRVSTGFLHSAIAPFNAYDYPPTEVFWGGNGKEGTSATEPYPAPRDEITMGLNTHYGPWKLATSARYDLESHEMDQVNATAAYEDECLIFKVIGWKRYTSIGGDHGETAVLIEITLKTVGEFGFHAM